MIIRGGWRRGIGAGAAGWLLAFQELAAIQAQQRQRQNFWHMNNTEGPEAVAAFEEENKNQIGRNLTNDELADIQLRLEERYLSRPAPRVRNLVDQKHDPQTDCCYYWDKERLGIKPESWPDRFVDRVAQNYGVSGNEMIVVAPDRSFARYDLGRFREIGIEVKFGYKDLDKPGWVWPRIRRNMNFQFQKQQAIAKKCRIKYRIVGTKLGIDKMRKLWPEYGPHYRSHHPILPQGNNVD